jgi:hypothetical protein
MHEINPTFHAIKIIFQFVMYSLALKINCKIFFFLPTYPVFPHNVSGNMTFFTRPDSGGFRGGKPPPPFSTEIYHQMLVKLKIRDPNYVIFCYFGGCPLSGAPLSPFRNF